MVEENITGLPDTDLSAIVNDLKVNQDKDQKVEPKTTDTEFDLAQFKNPKDLLKSYKEIQAAFTRVTQENKSTKEQLAQMQETFELARIQANQPPQIDPNTGLQDDTAVKFATFRIAEVLEEEAEKDKSDFQERYAYAQMVSQQYPNLARSARGVKKLFELGDKLKTENLRKNAGKALESIFGEPLGEEEITRLRTLVKGDKAIKKTNNLSNAYMPDTSTSTKSGSDQNRKPKYESEIKESVEKGDVDGVIKGIFDSVLAE